MIAYALALAWTAFTLDRWERFGALPRTLAALVCLLTWGVIVGTFR